MRYCLEPINSIEDCRLTKLNYSKATGRFHPTGLLIRGTYYYNEWNAKRFTENQTNGDYVTIPFELHIKQVQP